MGSTGAAFFLLFSPDSSVIKADPYFSIPPRRFELVGYSGVSSFGFGGANARADVFAIASRGPRKPKKVGGESWEEVGWPIFFSVSCFFFFFSVFSDFIKLKESRHSRFWTSVLNLRHKKLRTAAWDCQN